MAIQEAPPFWWGRLGWQALLLSPFAWVYGKIAAHRMEIEPSDAVPVPVICVGNYIAGGAGKTPTVIALAKAAKKKGLRPGILSRGHGGGISNATLVNLEKHNTRDVGDEPLLLAKVAKTAVSVDRPAGAFLLVEQDCNIIIMDDGFQNASLHKDFNLVVMNARRGVGNGFTHPAGPLRAPLSRQIPKTDALLVIGEGNGADKAIRRVAKNAKPIQNAKTIIRNKTRFRKKWLIAFAGIADPKKFFDSLIEAGAELFDRREFADHHHYMKDEVLELLNKAKVNKMQLVTTAKDFVRLRGMGTTHEELAQAVDVVEIDLSFDDNNFCNRILTKAQENAERRMVRGVKN